MTEVRFEFKIRRGSSVWPATFESEERAREWIRFEYDPENWVVLRRSLTDWEELPNV